MVNRLIIAAAGSGKTTYLVRQAMQQSDSVLITLIVKVVVSKNLYSCFDRLSDIVLYLT